MLVLDDAIVAREFPHAPRGYLNNASLAPVPVAVTAAVAAVSRASEVGRYESGNSAPAGWEPYTANARTLIARDLGTAPDAVSVVANTATALNTVAQALSLTPGGVVVQETDFPSVVLAFPGSRRVVVPDGADRTEVLIAALDSDTEAVAVSQVHASTGAILDLPRLHAACIEADALLVVDGTQAAGLVDAPAVNADVYVVSAYKWLMAGQGTAVAAVGPRFVDRAQPGLVGPCNVGRAGGLELGHENLLGLAALQAAAEVRHELGQARIVGHTTALVERLVTGLRELGAELPHGTGAAGIVSVGVSDAEATAAALSQLGITAAIRDGLIRFSPYVTTTAAGIDRVLEVWSSLALSAP